VAARLKPLIEGAEVAVSSVIVMEMLFSARQLSDFKATRGELEAGLQVVATSQQDFDRAIDVMEALASKGQHRSVPLPDLLIAAVSERAGLALLHYDDDFERIAEITKQPTEWVVPRGSI